MTIIILSVWLLLMPNRPTSKTLFKKQIWTQHITSTIKTFIGRNFDIRHVIVNMNVWCKFGSTEGEGAVFNKLCQVKIPYILKGLGELA